MAELADALASGASGRNTVEVRVFLTASDETEPCCSVFFIYSYQSKKAGFLLRKSAFSIQLDQKSAIDSLSILHTDISQMLIKGKNIRFFRKLKFVAGVGFIV